MSDKIPESPQHSPLNPPLQIRGDDVVDADGEPVFTFGLLEHFVNDAYIDEIIRAVNSHEAAERAFMSIRRMDGEINGDGLMVLDAQSTQRWLDLQLEVAKFQEIDREEG